MKRILFFLLCCCLLTTAAMGLTINKIATDCTVREDGGCEIVQTVELSDVDAAQRLTLPVSEGARSIAVDGHSPAVRGSLVTVEGGQSGDVTLVLRYTLPQCAADTDGGQRLTVELVPAQWEEPAAQYAFTVLLPKPFAAQPRFSGGYDGEGVEDKLTFRTVDRAVSGRLRGKLLDHDSFTMTLDVPEGYFRVSSARDGGAAQWILAAVIVLLAALAVWYWLRFLRSGRLHVRSRALPPDGITAAELPLLLCGAEPQLGPLLCEWADMGYLTVTEKQSGSILLRKSMDMGAERREEERRIFRALFRAGDVCAAKSPQYRKSAQTASSVLRRYWVRRLYDRASGGAAIPRILAALACGTALLNTVLLLPAFGGKWLVLIAAFAAGTALGAVICRAAIRAAVRSVVWIAAGAASFAALFLLARVIGGLLPMAMALALAIAAGRATCRGGRLTAAGVGAIEQCLGFQRFLESADETHLMSLLERDEQTVRRLLVYAHTIGLGGRFAARLGAAPVEACPWLHAADGTQTRIDALYRQLKRVLAQLA